MTFRAPLGTRLQPTDATAAINSQTNGSRTPLTALPFLLGLAKDFPNPRGPAPPLQDLWSEPSPALQIGLNPFIPADFPNPRGFTALTQSVIVRRPSVVASPFSQSDWPNPWAPARAGPDVVQRSPALLAPAPPSPFQQNDWPNPTGRPPLVQDLSIGFSLITQPGPAPFAQTDYPNPRGPAPLLQAFVSPPSGAQQITLKPFLQTDYPNPRAPGQPTADFALPNNTIRQLPPPIVLRPPLIQAIWRVDAMAAITAQFTGTRLPILVPPGVPFRPIDYPNPRGPAPLLQDFWTGPSAAQQITLKPFLQTDYPNPAGPAPIPQSMWLSIPSTLLPDFKPFFQADYPNPIGPAPLRQDVVRQNLVVAVLPVVTILRPPTVFRSWRVDSVVAVNSQSWITRLPNPSQPVVRSAIGTAFGAGNAIAIGSSLSSPFFNEYAAYVYQFPNTAIRFASYDPVSRLLWIQFFSGLTVVVPNISVGTASSINSAANGGEQFVLALARTVNPAAA